MDRRKIALILIVAGLMLYIPAFIIIEQQKGNINLLSYGPEAPAGVGGRVVFSNGSTVPDGVVVTAENLNTHDIETGVTENGWYAIGISAHDGDKIEISCSYNRLTGINYTTVDFGRATQWCNITLGQENKTKVDWWLLLIPTTVTIAGVVERKWNI